MERERVREGNLKGRGRKGSQLKGREEKEEEE